MISKSVRSLGVVIALMGPTAAFGEAFCMAATEDAVYVSGVYAAEGANEEVRTQEFGARVRAKHDIETFYGGVKCPSYEGRDETVRQREEQIDWVRSQDKAVIPVDWP